MSGATLHLVDRDTLLSNEKFVELINQKQITALTIPPSLLTLLPEAQMTSLETVISVGDACSWDLAQRWMDRCRFFNGYGPTEATVGASWMRINEIISLSSTAPIGKPIANFTLYILDENLAFMSFSLHPSVFRGGSRLIPVDAFWLPSVRGRSFVGGPGASR